MSEIKLEVGKTYQVREPQEVYRRYREIKILKQVPKDKDGYEFLASDGFTYRENGTLQLNGSQCKYDLVREVTP